MTARLAAVVAPYRRAAALLRRIYRIHYDRQREATVVAQFQAAESPENSGRFIPLLKRAVAIRERVLAPDNPYTASSLHDLALLHQAQGDPAAARPLFERALAIRERVLGADHPDTVATRRTLAELAAEGEDRATAGG